MLLFQIILLTLALALALLMSIVDWRTRIIPDVFLFPFLLIGLLLAALPFGDGFGGMPWVTGGITESIIAACIGYALGTVLNFAFKLRKNKKNSQKAQAPVPPSLRGAVTSAHEVRRVTGGSSALKNKESSPQSASPTAPRPGAPTQSKIAWGGQEGGTEDHDPIGLGDIKLLAAGGIWLGVTGLSIALITACAIGGIWGLCRRQRFVPFAPFFFTGMLVAIGIMVMY